MRNFINQFILLDEDDIGPPRNVQVRATIDGYLLSWDPPAQSKEKLKTYTVRWFEKDSQKLLGLADTTDTYYLGQKKCKILCVTLKALM